MYDKTHYGGKAFPSIKGVLNHGIDFNTPVFRFANSDSSLRSTGSRQVTLGRQNEFCSHKSTTCKAIPVQENILSERLQNG